MNQGLHWLAQKNSKSQRSNEINDLEICVVQLCWLEIETKGADPYHGLCA
jgi:hypothetical protein